ncbi:MAG: AraC family transcriptional regulator [Clostridium sp.]|nr:AraC family transcriptional regulator [Clostridium sp.]
MQKTTNVQYLYDKRTGMEMILCNYSMISYPLHNHVSVFTIGLVLQGSISLTVGNHSFICGKDDFFTVPPYMPHGIKAQNPYSLLTICINKNAIVQFGKEKIKNNIRYLINTANECELTEVQIRKLLDCVDLFENTPVSYTAEPVIDSARKQIEHYPERKISVDEMAHSAYVSKYHFIRSFKREVGLTPHRFQIQNRVRKAQRMMHDTDSLAEVALSAGFCDQSHFIRHFEKVVGLTPVMYKTSCRILT